VPATQAGRRHVTIGLVALVLVVGTAACGGGPPGSPLAGLGVVENRSIPAALTELPLTDQHGATVDLASFRGKTVMLVPFMTLCGEICPMTAGNLLQIEHALAQAHASSSVQIVELTGDPERDTVQRMAAYARLTGATWELVTETEGQRNAILRFLGFYFTKVHQDNPPAVDWFTDQPLTYDVLHANGYVLIDPRGRVRFLTGAAPDFHGTLNPTLHRFLSDQGRHNLAHPPQPGWNPTTALQTLGWLVGRTLPPTG
jgi:cytochrome oxidase Cu insertion factor (SCO1/SenC/PrrC family)